MDVINGNTAVQGEARLLQVFPPFGSWETETVIPSIGGDVWVPGRWEPKNDFTHNDVLYEWASIVGELLRAAPDGKSYHLGGMYIEFENNGGAAVSTPTVSRDEGSSYYSSLSVHATRDYLRVPMTARTLTSTDETNFPAGNRLTNFARTEGTAGVHGKTYSAAQQSRIYGAALVAYPDFSDSSQDMVFSRFYYSDSANQMIKVDGSEIGVEWRVNLQ